MLSFKRIVVYKKNLKLTMGLEQYVNAILPSFVILPGTLYEWEKRKEIKAY